jgi:hypothetical protein
MMVWSTHDVPRPIGLATWRVVHSIATSCRVIFSAFHAPAWSVAQRCTITRLCSRLLTRLAGMIM